MRSNAANFDPTALLLPIMLLLPAGVVWRSLEHRLTLPAELRAEQWVALAGQGGSPAIAGGFRSVLAGGFWLRTNLAWERRDKELVLLLTALTVAADERPAYFWLNGARMLAYDLPAWVPPDTPVSVRRIIIRVEANRALEFLEKGLRWHGADAALYIEMANIHLRQRGDWESAAHYYELAARQPGAPYYAARIHGELLHQLGRPGEALKWLQEILPTLPEDEPAARREVVQARIVALQRELAGR